MGTLLPEVKDVFEEIRKWKVILEERADSKRVGYYNAMDLGG